MTNPIEVAMINCNIEKFLGFFENPFREKEYIIDIEDLPSREEYLNAINVIGEWYINHVPT